MTSHDEQQALALRLHERAVLRADGPPPGQAGPPTRDRLLLADATLLAALAGARLLTPNERTALAASPLTLRRLRQLSLHSRGVTMPAAANPTAIAAGPAVAPEISAVTATAVASAAPTAAATTVSATEVAATTTAATAATAGATAIAAGSTAANDADWCGSFGMLRAASTTAETPETAASLITDDNCWTLHFVPQDGGWQVILALSAQAPFAARLLSEQPLLRVTDGAGATILQGRLDTDGECECGWPFTTAPAPHFQQHGAAFAVQPVQPLPPLPPEAP